MTFSFPQLPDGTRLTSTATDGTGNTSEFKNTGTLTSYGTNQIHDNGAGTGTITTAGPT